jgi:hypothetical protein
LVACIVDPLYSINGAPTPSIKAPPEYGNDLPSVEVDGRGRNQFMVLIEGADVLIPKLDPGSTIPKDPGLGFPNVEPPCLFDPLVGNRLTAVGIFVLKQVTPYEEKPR